MSREKHVTSISKLASMQEDQLGHEGWLGQLFFQTKPISAWILLVSCLGVAMLIGGLISSNDPIRGQQVGGAVVYLGWFVLFNFVHEPFSPNKTRFRYGVAFLFVAAIAAQASFSTIFSSSGVYEASPLFLRLIFWFVGFVGPILIVIQSARLLVQMENDGNSEVDQVIGTFLAMFLLPIGILLVQPRIRRLRSIDSGVHEDK